MGHCKKHDNKEHPCAKQLCLFLAEYAAWLLGAGGTCIRVERNVKRIAERFELEAVMTIMPRHIHMTVCSPDRWESYTYIAPIATSRISFDINTRLSELSWAIADRRINFKQAKAKFHNTCMDPPDNRWMVLVLASLANAAFCRLFGGDVISMGIVFVATAVGFYIKQTLAAWKVDVRLIFIICAFVSTVLGATGGLFGIGNTPDVAIGTSVLYLVPGIPFLNSFSDMLAGHYICAFSRFMNAVVLTASLSLGLCAGMLMMNVGMF